MSYDVIVVGGSFAGLAAALQVARTRREVLVIDAGLPRNRFAREAHGIVGHDGRPPQAILADARAQLSAYPSAHLITGVAMRAEQNETGFTVSLETGADYTARRLVLATGVKDQIPHLPGFAERWGVSLLHCPYCHGYELPAGPIGVMAPARAIDDRVLMHVQLIREWGPVTFFTHGQTLDEAAYAELASHGVQIRTEAVVGLVGDAPRLAGVALASGEVVPSVGLFTAFPTVMSSPLAEQLGCAFDAGPSGPTIRIDAGQQTTVPGVYAAGDAAMAMHNATLATAAGVMAGISAHKSLVFGAS